METTPSGSQVGVKTVETATVAGSVFGIAIVGKNRGVYFVDDGSQRLVCAAKTSFMKERKGLGRDNYVVDLKNA